VHDQETPEQKAIRLLKRQLDELQTIRDLSYQRAEFKAWRDTTRGVLERYLGKENHHTSRFANTRFLSQVINTAPWGGTPPQGYVSNEDRHEFREGCSTAEQTLKAAIREIEDFGVYEGPPKPASTNRRNRGGNGGVTQTFNAPVSIHNLAVAADNAVQRIGHMGDDKTGASLKEIAELLQQSEELSRREVKEGLTHIQAMAVEVAKPEANRNWKAVLTSGQAILDITNKATDLAKKIAPYTPAILSLVDQAKHWIK
jgi:hypothetical protein